MSHRLIPLPADETSRLLRYGLALGGLCGAAGVALLAVAAHADTTGLMRSAAEMLLFHAPVFLILGAIAQARRIPLLSVAFLFLAVGLALFCGDMLRRALDGARLFPMAAPIGGMLIISGWVAILLSPIRISSR